MNLDRTPLLVERSFHTVHGMPKARTRRIATKRLLGGTRRSLFARIERRVRERVPGNLSRDTLRGITAIKYQRRKPEKSVMTNRPRAIGKLLKGFRL